MSSTLQAYVPAVPRVDNTYSLSLKYVNIAINALFRVGCLIPLLQSFWSQWKQRILTYVLTKQKKKSYLPSVMNLWWSSWDFTFTCFQSIGLTKYYLGNRIMNLTSCSIEPSHWTRGNQKKSIYIMRTSVQLL